MILAEQHDEWSVARRYMSSESLAKAALEVIEGDVTEELRGELATASCRSDHAVERHPLTDSGLNQVGQRGGGGRSEVSTLATHATPVATSCVG
jgi:hypothetical protein